MKVRIKNVQSIKNIEFDIKGFTCIVGKSNIGKSAILRAIRSLFKNKGGIVRKDAEYAEVEIDDDDLKIHWEKGKKKNDYVINGKEYNKMNRDIPPPILEAGIREIKVGNSKIDLQTNNQFYPLFLVDKSGREAAEVVSMVSRLDVISKASRLCIKDVKSDRSKLKFKKEEYQALAENLNNFFQLDDILLTLDISTKKYEKLESQKRSIDYLTEKRKYLIKINQKINLLNTLQKVKIFPFLLDQKEQALSRLSKTGTQLQRIKNRVQILDSLQTVKIPGINDKKLAQLKKLKQINLRIKQLSLKANQFQKIQKLNIPAITIDQEIKVTQTLQNLQKRLKDSQKEIDKLNANIKQIEQKIKGSSSNIKQLEEELGICPVCNKEF